MKPFRSFQSVFLTCTLLFGSFSWGQSQTTQNPSPSSPRIQKVREQVQKIGRDQDVTVILTSDLEYYGMIIKIGTDSFEIDEADLRQIITVPYKDVRDVQKGYSRVDPSTGRRVSNRTKYKYTIITVASIGALVGFTIWGFSKLKRKEPRLPPGFPR
jgi:hypothetical protein